MDHAYLTTTCQFEVDGYPQPGDCGEPAVARVWWDNDFEMLVCQEHLDFIIKREAEAEKTSEAPAGE